MKKGYYETVNDEAFVYKNIETVLNLIQTQQEEIFKLQARVDRLTVILKQYENLRRNFNRLRKEVLGEDYYNLAMDVYKCDEIVCDDIIKKFKKE